MDELNSYLDAATAKIPYRKDARRVRDELEDHILTKAELICLSGLNEEAAIHKAIASMGNVRELTSELAQIHSRIPQLEMRRIMSMGILAMFILFFHFQGLFGQLLSWIGNLLLCCCLLQMRRCHLLLYVASLLGIFNVFIQIIVIFFTPAHGFTNHYFVLSSSAAHLIMSLLLFLWGIGLFLLLKRHYKSTVWALGIAYQFLHYLSKILVRDVDNITLFFLYLLLLLIPLLHTQKLLWESDIEEPVQMIKGKDIIYWCIAAVLLFLLPYIGKLLLKSHFRI